MLRLGALNDETGRFVDQPALRGWFSTVYFLYYTSDAPFPPLLNHLTPLFAPVSSFEDPFRSSLII